MSMCVCAGASLPYHDHGGHMKAITSWWEHEGQGKLLLKLPNQCYWYVVLAVVIALLFVLATLMAMRTTSGWLAALVIMWMVLCWAIALLLRMHLQQGVATCHQKNMQAQSRQKA